MKPFIVFVLMIGIYFNAFSQNFEGKILYSFSYESKNPSVTSDQYQKMMGSLQEYYVKGGNYKSTSNGMMMEWQLYLQKDNKLYNKLHGTGTILWNDGNENKNPVLDVKLNTKTTDVAGYPCQEWIITCKEGIERYFFHKDIAMDPELYSQHKFGNWHEVISRCKAIPLKYIIENKDFIINSTAKEVKPMVIDDKIFVLPTNLKMIKSPY